MNDSYGAGNACCKEHEVTIVSSKNTEAIL
jgi:hypothetical protein